MTQNQSALSTLLTELLDDPDMAHDQVFRESVRFFVCGGLVYK